MFLVAILTRGDLKVAIAVLIDTAPVEGRRVAMHFLLFFLLFFMLYLSHISPLFAVFRLLDRRSWEATLFAVVTSTNSDK